MNEKTFWSLVAEQNWPATAADVNREAARFFLKHGEAVCKEYEKMVRSKRAELCRVVENYEEENDVSCECGDDGWSDLTHHFVGLGEKVYNDALKHPEKVVEAGRKFQYKESFSYVVPSSFTKEDLNPQKYIAWAAKAHKEITVGTKMDSGEIYNEYEARNADQVSLDKAVDVCIQVAAGNFKAIAEKWTKDKARKLANQIHCWSVPNMIIDLLSYADLFTDEQLSSLVTVELSKYDKFNRTKVVKFLNERFIRKVVGNPEKFAKVVLKNGFVPYEKRSRKELEKMMAEIKG